MTPLSSSLLFAFIAKQASSGVPYLFGQLWPDILAKLPPKTLLPASPVMCVRGDGLEWSPAQQQPKPWCALSTFLSPAAKPSIVTAAMGKIISIQPELQKPFISLPLASPLNIKSLSGLPWK